MPRPLSCPHCQAKGEMVKALYTRSYGLYKRLQAFLICYSCNTMSQIRPKPKPDIITWAKGYLFFKVK